MTFWAALVFAALCCGAYLWGYSAGRSAVMLKWRQWENYVASLYDGDLSTDLPSEDEVDGDA